jgi:hypothetical protein
MVPGNADQGRSEAGEVTPKVICNPADKNPERKLWKLLELRSFEHPHQMPQG